MTEKILIEDFEKEKAIELSDGTVLNLPQRTAETYEMLMSIESSRHGIPEYDYNKKILELFYGKEGFKKIAPAGKKTNLDYLTKVQTVSVNLFCEQKNEAEIEELSKRAEMFEPLTGQIQALSAIKNMK